MTLRKILRSYFGVCGADAEKAQLLQKLQVTEEKMEQIYFAKDLLTAGVRGCREH